MADILLRPDLPPELQVIIVQCCPARGLYLLSQLNRDWFRRTSRLLQDRLIAGLKWHTFIEEGGGMVVMHWWGRFTCGTADEVLLHIIPMPGEGECLCHKIQKHTAPSEDDFKKEDRFVFDKKHAMKRIPSLDIAATWRHQPAAAGGMFASPPWKKSWRWWVRDWHGYSDEVTRVWALAAKVGVRCTTIDIVPM